ncbi:biotin/lipoyl-containing protein, partial [Nocardia wallacei]|uniref:biotin/lipoyl-containing protein n=1 Tax=Nocardia wallacei TaxID=480035 RepID=UPI00245545DE
EKDGEESVRDGQLTIQAERCEKHEERGRSEFSYGSFVRTVTLPAHFAGGAGGPAAAGNGAGVIRKKPKPRKRGGAGGGAASGDAVTAPMQGTVVKVAVEEGQSVEAGDLIVVLEAMKMENPVNAHKSGVVTGLSIAAGAAITQGTVLAEIK